MAADHSYWFKLEFPDRRWSVEEMSLPVRPAHGDCVDLGAAGRWLVCGSESVRVRPAGKPDRELFVCSPA
jgi:hypothetical protein